MDQLQICPQISDKPGNRPTDKLLVKVTKNHMIQG